MPVLFGGAVGGPQGTEPTALEAAYRGGLAWGVWRAAHDIAALWQVDRRFEPSLSDVARRHKLQRWHEAVQRSRGWARG